jgi:hypothetical protein
MSAGADLIIERTVDLVLFRTKDRGEVVGHGVAVDAPISSLSSRVVKNLYV